MNPLLKSRGKKPRKGAVKTCPICQTEFYVVPAEIERRVSCSPECRVIYRARAKEMACESCGKTFTRAPRTRTVFCSRECSEARGETNATCRTCGNAFYKRPCKLQEARYCSQACKTVGMRGPRPSTPPWQGRFWAKVVKTESCWFFTGEPRRSGSYGRLRIGSKFVQAHRLSWELHFGPIPEELLVCHRCDIPACVNPDHLFLGTTADNARDMVEKRRHAAAVSPETVARGERSYRAKLTETDVREIRRRVHEEGASWLTLGRRYGVSAPAIGKIVWRKTWRHVT